MSIRSTDLVLDTPPLSTDLWPEPLDTPGWIPRHLKRSASTSFPVLEVLHRILYRLRPTNTSVTGDLERGLAVIALYQAAQPVYKHLKNFFLWACTVQITVPESDPIAKEILAWMGAEIIRTTRTRSAMLVTATTETHTHFHTQVRFPSGSGDPADEEVTCLPPLGTRIFWVGFRPFLFSRSGGQSFNRNNNIMSGNLINNDGQLQNALTISTLGWNLASLQRFTELCHQFKLKNLTGTTTVYFAGGSANPYGDAWQSVSKAKRKLDTIDMDEDIKNDIIRDAEYYYSEQSRRFFADCGIPYRRGYLFYGPPGTGKSSFSAALAGHLQCDIYHINLSSGDISDGGLHSLFLGLPRKCVVVIEDIDSAGIGREQGPAAPLPPLVDTFEPSKLSNIIGGPVPLPRPPPTDSYSRSKRNTVTLSGLLNAIDGNASQEGRLLIMTSNNPNALDVALTRPGRIDKKVYFGNMSKTAIKSIYMRLIGRSALAHDAAFTMAEIEQYANQFAEKVPVNTFTPAQMQNFLQGCRNDPLRALREVDAWVDVNREKSESTSASGSSDTSASFISHTAEADAAQPT